MKGKRGGEGQGITITYEGQKRRGGARKIGWLVPISSLSENERMMRG
jgi:hypothetical protein